MAYIQKNAVINVKFDEFSQNGTHPCNQHPAQETAFKLPEAAHLPCSVHCLTEGSTVLTSRRILVLPVFLTWYNESYTLSSRTWLLSLNIKFVSLITLIHGATVCSFSSPSIPLYEYTTHYLSVLLLIRTWMLSRLGLLWVVPLWTSFMLFLW